ncbi:unnamed protein product [Porites evermanni]|uniref:Uncharacterized protein n=1 Tax=Porites evermanni TaxID=104178 RepID=A0ABN8SV61_9CNID|nr:unnamed protein product [Porites evermanni]
MKVLVLFAVSVMLLKFPSALGQRHYSCLFGGCKKEEMEDNPAYLPKSPEIASLKNEYRRNRLRRLSEYLKTKRNQFDDVM